LLTDSRFRVSNMIDVDALERYPIRLKHSLGG